MAIKMPRNFEFRSLHQLANLRPDRSLPAHLPPRKFCVCHYEIVTHKATRSCEWVCAHNVPEWKVSESVQFLHNVSETITRPTTKWKTSMLKCCYFFALCHIADMHTCYIHSCSAYIVWCMRQQLEYSWLALLPRFRCCCSPFSHWCIPLSIFSSLATLPLIECMSLTLPSRP